MAEVKGAAAAAADGKPANAAEEPKSTSDRVMSRLGINPNLLMLKVTLFLLYGAIASLLPYLTIHMQSIGLTVEEISVIYFTLPFTTFLSPPITGFLVDKFGQYKPVVVLALILNAAFHHALLLIPPMETPGEIPPAYIARHPVSGLLEVWWSPCPSRECPDEEELELVLERCFSHCELLSDGMWAAHHNGSTELNELDIILAINDTINSGEVNNDDFHFLLDMHPDLGEPVENLGMEVEPEDGNNDTLAMFRSRFGDRLLWTAGVNVTGLEEEDLRCGGVALASNLSGPAIRRMATVCPLQKCSFRKGGPEECPPSYKESDDRTFWIYFALRFLGTASMSAGVTMLDPIALTMIQRYGGEFGRERVFSTIGMAIFSPITGFLIDHSSRNLGYTDYSAAFYAHDILLVTSALAIMAMPLGVKVPADDLLRDVLRIVRMPHVTIFIFFLFVLGNFWGFIESFLFLYLKELGAPNYLLGLTLTVGTMSSMPFLFGADSITKRFGHVNIIVIAFFSHAARLMGYSLIEDPWWSFPFEALEALAVHLMWVAAATYCALLAPRNLLATIIGVLGMAHFSLGRGSGSFMGGFLLATLGTRTAFRVMGYLAAGGGVIYGLLHAFWLRRYDLHHAHPAADEEAAPEGEEEVAEEMPQESTGMLEVGANSVPSTPKTPRTHRPVPLRFSLMIGVNPRGSLTELDVIRSSNTDLLASGGVSGHRSLLKAALEASRGSNVGGSTPSSPNLKTSARNVQQQTFFTPQQIRRGAALETPSGDTTPTQQRRRALSSASAPGSSPRVAARAIMRDSNCNSPRPGRRSISPLATPRGSMQSDSSPTRTAPRSISPLARQELTTRSDNIPLE